MSLYRMKMFIIPSTIRKVAETLLPIIPPTRENAPNRDETAAAVDATTIEVMTTMLVIYQYVCIAVSMGFGLRRMSQGEESTDCNWTLPSRNQTPSHKVNGLSLSVSCVEFKG